MLIRVALGLAIGVAVVGAPLPTRAWVGTGLTQASVGATVEPAAVRQRRGKRPRRARRPAAMVPAAIVPVVVKTLAISAPALVDPDLQFLPADDDPLLTSYWPALDVALASDSATAAVQVAKSAKATVRAPDEPWGHTGIGKVAILTGAALFLAGLVVYLLGWIGVSRAAIR